jgi:hypothetical protein
MAIFQTPYDIANISLQLLGVPRITTFADSTRQAKETSFVYDKSRRSELRRFVWTFATRRAILRPVTATLKQIAFGAWSGATAYVVGDFAAVSGQSFEAISAGTNKTPNTDVGMTYWDAYSGPAYADNWSSTVTYFPGDIVYKSTTVYRLAGVATSLNNDPASGAPWLAPAGATLGSLVSFRAPSFFDAGVGLGVGAPTRTAYPLPQNFLRIAPQDAKQPAIERLGTTAGMQFNDWEIEGGVLYSSAASGGIIMRFVADTVVVPAMDDLFCHAVGCRMALDMNEILTQRADLAAKCAAEYQRFVTEARAVSAIEMGSTEQDFMQPQPAQPQGGNRGGV